MDNFDFGGNVGSIYQSAPSSPKRFGDYYLSAPASPSRLSELYNQFEYFSSTDPSSSFEAANKVDDGDENSDYSFAFYVNDDKSSRPAEELFAGGKIKLLDESRSKEPKRGREREREKVMTTTTLSSSNSGRRAARSHSPYRKSTSHYLWEAEQQQQQQQQSRRSIKEEPNSCSKGSKSKKNNGEEVKGSSSFRSSDSRKKGPVSAHELHYAMKKAESEDMKKKTFLPYRQGILGRLAGFGL
uniref:Uncharacterized protein n=1 Tax=Cajanus cajan TaxID=3821 RepID=A0A151S7Z8_CAJCA|nr:hypothetical protein KK1_027305 [Cajanus cajan]